MSASASKSNRTEDESRMRIYMDEIKKLECEESEGSDESDLDNDQLAKRYRESKENKKIRKKGKGLWKNWKYSCEKIKRKGNRR